MKLERNTILLAIGTAVCGLFGIYSDFLLSYKAYQIDSVYFIAHEANKEIVGFFADNEFPFFFFVSIITFPVATFLFACYLQKHKTSKYKKEFFICFILLVYCITVTRILAGLTWFSNTRDMTFLFQNITYILLGVVGCLSYIMNKEAKEIEEKNSSKNSSI